jgi:hypothetical protein
MDRAADSLIDNRCRDIDVFQHMRDLLTATAGPSTTFGAALWQTSLVTSARPSRSEAKILQLASEVSVQPCATHEHSSAIGTDHVTLTPQDANEKSYALGAIVVPNQQ